MARTIAEGDARGARREDYGEAPFEDFEAGGGGRNHLQANRSLAFRFQVTA